MRALLSTLALTLLLPTTAGADAVPPTPDCPPGARGLRSHSGQWCETSPCSTDHDCTGGTTCAPLRMCVVTSSIAPRGLRPAGSEPPPRIANIVVASCAASADCAGSDETAWPLTAGDIADRTPRCAVATYCVDPSSVPATVEPATVEPATVEPVPTATAEPVPTAAPAPTTAAPEATGGCSSGHANGSGTLAYLALVFLALIARRSRTA